jgi:hypothetical protein
MLYKILWSPDAENDLDELMELQAKSKEATNQVLKVFFVLWIYPTVTSNLDEESNPVIMPVKHKK